MQLPGPLPGLRVRTSATVPQTRAGVWGSHVSVRGDVRTRPPCTPRQTPDQGGVSQVSEARMPFGGQATSGGEAVPPSGGSPRPAISDCHSWVICPHICLF